MIDSSRLTTRIGGPGRLATHTARLLLAAALLLAYHAYRSERIGQHIDFDLYYFGGLVERTGTYTDTPAVMAVAKAQNKPVAPEGVFGSPTLVGIVYQPLTFLNRAVALRIWEMVALVALITAVRRCAGDEWWPLWLAVAVLSTSNIVAFTLGNFAIATTALMAFAIGSCCSGRHRQGGVALGIAIACKFYPAFLVLPLLFKRETIALRWAAATAVALFAVTPFVLGWHDTVSAVHSTVSLAGNVPLWGDNDGIPGLVARMTGSQSLAIWASRFCVVMAGWTIWLFRRQSLWTLMAIAVLTMLLAVGISWNIYYGVTLTVFFAARRLWPSPAAWAALTVAYVITNGVLLYPTYELFGMPRGLPLALGLGLSLAVLIDLTQIPERRILTLR